MTFLKSSLKVDIVEQIEKPNIAILLAVYNGTPWLDAQVESILAQENVNITLFISIDPSSDTSAQWCDSLAQKHHNVIIVDRGPSLMTAAQNFFNLIRKVDFSAYEYISFSDQDDLWKSGKLSAAVNKLKNSKFDGYSSNVEAFWSNEKKELINKAQKQTKWDYFFEAAGPGCTYVMTRKLMQDIQQCLTSQQKLSEGLRFHDWFCYAFAREGNYHWFIDNNSYLHYRQHGENVVGVNQGVKAFLHRAKHALSGNAIEQSKITFAILSKHLNSSPNIKLPSNRLDYLKLACMCYQCRRSAKDKVFFFLFCSIMILYKKGSSK